MRFLHCADIHLDSPLRGPERCEGAPVEQVRERDPKSLREHGSSVRPGEGGASTMVIGGDLP